MDTHAAAEDSEGHSSAVDSSMDNVTPTNLEAAETLVPSADGHSSAVESKMDNVTPPNLVAAETLVPSAEDLQSGKDPPVRTQPNTDMVTVTFYAVLRNSATFNHDEDSMWICGKDGKIQQMFSLSSQTDLKSGISGTLFRASLPMDQSDVFLYKYSCFNKNGKEQSEQITVDGLSGWFRMLTVKELLLPDCNEIQQFDDICMKSEKFYHMGFKKTEITDIRPNFLHTVLYSALKCNHNELFSLEKKVEYILKCIQYRNICAGDSPKCLLLGLSQHLAQPLKTVIESLKPTYSVSVLLATMFFLKYTNMELENSLIEKLCEFAKTKAKTEEKIPDITDTMRRDICNTVKQLFKKACGRVDGAVWLVGLFYKVHSHDESIVEDFHKNTWNLIATDKQCQKELLEMVKCHEQQLQQHCQFAQFVLSSMFSVTLGDCKVLKYLGLEPFDILLKLQLWITNEPRILSSDRLSGIIYTVADITKKWLQSRNSDVTTDKTVVDCVTLTMELVKKMQMGKQDGQLTENIISALTLLNSFSAVLELLQGKKEIMDLDKNLFLDVEGCLVFWITTAAEKIVNPDLQFFTRVFQLELPPPWRERWKETLKNLFTEWLQKIKEKRMVELYCGYYGKNSTIEECLLQCAIKTVKSNVGYLGTIMESKKSSKLISNIITDIWKDVEHEALDWECLLTNLQSLELLSVLGKVQQRNPSFKNELTDNAKRLLIHVQNLLSELCQSLYELPFKLTLHLLEKKEITGIIQLHLENKSVLGSALEKVRAEKNAFQDKQEQSKALLQLIQLIHDKSEVNTEHIKGNIAIDVSTESRSLSQLLKLWEGVDIMRFGNIQRAAKSKMFKKHWQSASENARQAHDAESMQICELYERIYKPAFTDLTTSYKNIQDLSMQVDEFEAIFGDCDERQIEEELTLLQEYLEPKDNQRTWIKDVCNCITCYRQLCNRMKSAQTIWSLKEELCLEGDFNFLPELCQKDSVRTKCLRNFSEEKAQIIQKLNEVDDNVLGLIEEFNDCVKKGFIEWIRSVIKDQRELNVFVELASAFAGENTMDLDKVRNFRDCVFACASLIFEIDVSTGFDELMDKIKKLKEPLENDCRLHEKLRDSCTYKPWLDTAHAAHGSVTKSSLLQAGEINEAGVYVIRQPSSQHLMTLEDCISLEIREGNSVKKFELSQLQDLQNKLMLISATDRQESKQTVSLFVEVLEQILHAGQLLIKLREAGHILFTNWSLTGFCDKSRKLSVHVDFGIAGLKLTGTLSLLEELKGICKSMQDCLDKWINYTKEHRDEYYYLNYFTAKQLSALSCFIAEMQQSEQVSSSDKKIDKQSVTRVLSLLSFIKENVTMADLLDAFKAALTVPVQNAGSLDLQSSEVQDYLIKYPNLIEYVVDAGYSEASAKAAVMCCKHAGAGLDNTDLDEDVVMDCVYENSNDDAWVEEWCVQYDEERESVLQNQVKFTGGHTPEQMKPAFTMSAEEMMKMFENLTSCQEKIMILWETYCGKLSGLVSDKYVGLDLLGETLKQLAQRANPIKRKLPRFLEKGKPNLVTCKNVEMLPQCLSLYLDEEQPLPTYDELLICTAETTSEEVDLIIRRAVQSGSNHEKFYSLLNAENLKPDVARILESKFYHLSQNRHEAEAKEYSFVIFCDTKAHHSYVLTAFDEYRKTLLAKEYKQIQQLLKMKHKLSNKAAFPVDIIPEEFRQSIKMICSDRAGMGKTLFVKNLMRTSKNKLASQGFTHKTISITDKEIKPGFIYEKLKENEDNPNDNIPKIFHFDVPPVVCKGLYSFLIQLFVLRCFQSLDGFIWKCKDTHIYLVEYTERKLRQCDRDNSEISTDLEDCLLAMFTTVRCFSPKKTLEHLTNNTATGYEFQLMDETQFKSEEFQRTYQYLKHFQRNSIDQLKLERKSMDSPEEWLECILHYCKISNPSWAELCNFTQFLNMQLKRCEDSVFCSDLLRDDLTDFRHFVVKSMITMSIDFSMPSLVTSDESCGPERNETPNDVLDEFQIRKHWEQEAHPYIMFNSDGVSMTFLGFHIQNLNAVDVSTGKIIERNFITGLLFRQLKTQEVPMNVDFKALKRSKQIEILCRVLGVQEKDPDCTYQLTLDNALKILAIHLRFQCNIPVVIMGETGCGKTRLVKFMCDLLQKDKDKANLMVVRVHGGTTSDMIYKKVEKAIKDSKSNSELGMYTVLFFDEANTTEALYAIKEVMCDRTIRGEQIDAPDLKFIAACNPYRKHTKSAIEQLEKAGLGYRVRAVDASEKLGKIPMRQLVYRVQPLPASFSPLVWDFGKLNEHTQCLYITKMVDSFFQKENLDNRHKSKFRDVINKSQSYMTKSSECRMVSLRDIERCMTTVMWFYQQRAKLFPLIDEKKENADGEGQTGTDDTIRSLILAVGVCYSASLEDREEYIEIIARALCVTAKEILDEIILCQEVFVDNVYIPDATAKNDALKENVFMMIVCMNLRLPLFLVGKPGSSKSLSKTVAADALQGESSRTELFRSYKQAQLLSFQCSAHSTSDGIVSTFRQCAQLQKGKDLEKYVSVVVLDEIGLAEDSPKMPLKTLHPLLECGCIDVEEPEDFKKVGFIGLSNWSLDPAKMNRGILLLRASPGEQELEKTAKGICSAAKPFNTQIEENLPKITKVYLDVLQKQDNEFYGLRDYYNLIKVIVTYAQCSDLPPSTIDLARAVQRNFGVLDFINSLEIFSKEFSVEIEQVTTIDLVRENLEIKNRGLESRYLLLLSSNNAALSILLRLKIITGDTTEVIFGSGFPLDQEYSQVCRTVNRVKTCMETGRSVVLLNIQNLYESLYDALNQCYVTLGGSVYVDLGLGAHRVKCKVKEGFQLIIIEDKNVVHEQFPTPLLSRLEKHCLEFKTILPEHAKKLQDELEKQITETFSCETQKTCDALIGFTQDSCASVLLQCCPEILSEDWDTSLNDDILNQCRETLVQCATLDSVIRVSKNTDEIQNIYFKQQTHTNLMDVIKRDRSDNDKGMCLEVSTYSLLLNQRNLKYINQELNISKEQSFLLQIREFQTEQAFCEAVRKCFQTKEDRVLILLQFYFENPKLSQRLLSCARYCITKLLKESEECVVADVILLIRLPRVLGGCGYIAVSGDDWDCVHMDELMPTKGLTADMELLCRMSVSEVFEQSMTHDDTDDICKQPSEITQQADKLVDTWLLMKMSMQNAIIQLNDKVDNSNRAQRRIEILHDLLHANHDVSGNFLKILERRIVNILAAREKENSKCWVTTLAESKSFIVEGTSFRHVLWIHMEDAVASAMAQVFAIVDGDNNLDHVTIGQPTDVTDLWIKIFQEQELLTIPVLPKLSYSVLSTSNTKEMSSSCRFPFSWVVKARFDQIWKQVHNLPGINEMSKLEQIQKCEELIKFPWLYGMKSTHSLFQMYAEDLVRMSMPECKYEVNQAFSVALVELAKNVYKDLMQADPNEVSLLWLHVTYEGMRDNHHIFCKLSQQCEEEIKTGDVKEATEAMHLFLEKQQPSNDLLKDYTTCQEWLNKVKSVSTSVELIVSDNSLVQQHGKRGQELIKKIRCLWHSTQVVYLLMDNLLQDKTQMDEKLLAIITKNFIHFSKRIIKKDLDMEQTFEEVIRVLKQCNTNACKTYQTIDCASCGNEFKDPVELPCGHIFCKLCIDGNCVTQCFTCNKPFGSSYKPCEPLKREAILQMTKFQRHCNSFFVEYIMKCCVENNTKIPDKVINLLLDFVRGNPKKKDAPRRKTSELSPFHEVMDPSPAVQSLVLRILLKSRMDEMKEHLQSYIEAAVKSNQKNTDEFYFMVVRSTEDQIQRSARKAMIPKANECINMDLSSFEDTECDVTFDVLHNIAKIRFAVSVAADVIGDVHQNENKMKAECETDLLQKVQEMVEKYQWVQIFLLRNLCNKFDFKIMESVQHNERLSWIVPKGLQTIKDETCCTCTDKFLVYGAMYKDLTDTEDLKDRAANENSPLFPVCAALAATKQILHDRKTAERAANENSPLFQALEAVKQMLHDSTTDEEKNSLVKQVEMVSKHDKKWKKISDICAKMMENTLSKVSSEVCLAHDSSLTPIILHTVFVVNQSMAPEMNLLKTLCLQPGKLKETFIPTMPDTEQEMEGLKGPQSTEKFWKCQCGEPVLIENCGKPWIIDFCPKCKRMIGGELHKPVPGFTEIKMSADDHKGYILGDSSNRAYPDSERDLSGASLCLIRALIHACLLWGATDHYKATQDLIADCRGDVGKFLSDHLRKDIELLGKALGKNTENAEIAVHMFLRQLLESPLEEPSNCTTDICTTREERNEWENIMKSRTRTFFKDFEKKLSEVHNNILKWGETNPVANIVYSDLPKMKDLPTDGPFNSPIMWRYEQKMTIQLLTHLIEQDSSKKCPALLDLMRKHGHIKNIRHLPLILNLQQKLMHYFLYVDSAEWKDLTFEDFLQKAPQADVLLLEESTNVLMNIWENLKDSSYVDIPAQLKDKSMLMISDLLPLENPQTLMRIVTCYLAKLQNDCINSARTPPCGTIESENLKPSHVITCDLEEDFLPIAISNIGNILNEDGTEAADYNFEILEKQLISRFITEKPIINLSTLPMMERNPVKTLQSFFANVKKILEPLSVQDKNYIMNEMRFINEISAALSTLKIAIGFLGLSSSVTSADTLLVNYMKTELRMEERSKHLQLPVLRTCQVKHIQSLWEVLFTRRSALLTEMNQEPFYMINTEFRVEFSEEEDKKISSALSKIQNLDLFIIELHDVIMNIETKGMNPKWNIGSTFETFLLYEKQLDEKTVESLCKHLGEDLDMKNVVSLWKLAVQRRAQNT